MEKLFMERERRDLARVRLVLDLGRERGCLTRWLLHYFGEERQGDCGNCTSCKERAAGTASEHPRLLPSAADRGIGAEDVRFIRSLIDERHPSLRTGRQLARFLCGITSPATSRERLTRHDAFGLLAQVPFQEVLAQTETML
jgi:ATP-dependent DNA helicase RecQ